MSSPFSEGKLQISWSQLLENPEFRQRNQGAFAKASDSVFSLGSTLPLGLADPIPNESDILVDEDAAVFLPGQAMVVLVDNNCRRTRASTATFSADLEDNSPGKPQLDIEAYSYGVKDPLPVSQFRNWLESDPCIVGASEDLEVSVTETILNNDPMFDNLSHLKAINYVAAQDLFHRSSLKIDRDVVIAIVDTGIDYRHNDLRNRMWTNGSGNYGHDYINNDTDPMDDHKHGTHCAGLAAAENNNNVGVSGVMGFNAKLMAVKVLAANGSGSTTTVVNGVNFAVTNKADVINMSLGGKGTSAAYRDALARAVAANVFVAVAAGNDNVQINSGTNFFSPAGYAKDINGAMAVGSFDALSFAKSGFSNYSTTYVEIGAPGSAGSARLISTVPNNAYEGLQGTSMASPVLAGAAALTIGILRSQGISYTPADIEEILTNSSPSRSGLSSYFKGGKYLDVERTAEYVQRVYLFSATGGFK
ncbi:MAG: S8 family serine peptidase [Bdellovibrionales bacterium]|nr:S8 family serine peptidase [Bdellovibrionales bacterium]